MAGLSQVYQNKRGRNEYWNGGLALPDAKRSNSRTLAHDSDLMSLLDMIDNMDNTYDSNPDGTDVGINGIIMGGSYPMGSIKLQGHLIANGSTEAAISATPDLWDFTYYEDVGADLITPHELGIMLNDIHGDSMPYIMYSDAVYGYAQTTEVFYGSLWEDDIWQFNEHPVIQNDFEYLLQEDLGVASGVQFHDVWNEGRPV